MDNKRKKQLDPLHSESIHLFEKESHKHTMVLKLNKSKLDMKRRSHQVPDNFVPCEVPYYTLGDEG